MQREQFHQKIAKITLSFVNAYSSLSNGKIDIYQKGIEYLKSQRLARIATAAASTKQEGSAQPDVVPVGFDFDGEYQYVGGMNLLKSTKFRNVLKNNKVAIVIDDLKSIDPWDLRGIRIYDTADIVTRQGGYMENTNHPNPQYIRVNPQEEVELGS